MRSRRRTSVAALLAALIATLAAPAGAPALVKVAQPAPFTLSLQALRGGSQTDLYINVSSATAPLPESLTLVQVKVFAPDGSHLRTETFHDVVSPSGAAAIPLSGLERNQVVEVKTHAKDGDENNLEAQTKVLLRPDLTVRSVAAPARVVRRQSFGVQAEIAELAGDVGANATVSLHDAGAVIATAAVAVAAGGSTSVTFPLQFARAGKHSFAIVVSGATPAEANSANNDGSAAVNVAQYDLDGAVASDEANATDAGVAVLANGGNAVDAAVAMQFVLSVTQPQNVSIGGGATIVVHLTEGNPRDFAIDARETAPAATLPGDYQNELDSSGINVGVPGAVRAADTMLRRWGSMSLAETLQPAISLAENGFEINEALARSTENGRRCQNVGQPEAKAVFCPLGGRKRGDTLVQTDLAKTLRLLAERGANVLYEGELAHAIVEAQKRTSGRAAGGGKPGKMTEADLSAYDVSVTPPVFASYHGYDVLSAAGSSSGGIVVLQALKMLRRFPLAEWGHLAPNTTHVMAEAMRLAFRDRGFWMGGGPVPVDGLLSDQYTSQRSALIQLDGRLPVPVPIGNPIPFDATGESADFDADAHALTSHFSVLDKWGNAVSFTTTVTDAYGTGIMVPGYGFMVNDSLSNFNAVPQASSTNPGINDAGPGKRAMGNTAPVIVLKDGEPVLVTGSPGGATIQSVVLDVVTSIIDHKLSLDAAVDSPRFWFIPPLIQSNPGVPDATIAHLRALGHTVQPNQPFPQVGAAQSVAADLSRFALSAATDRLTPDAKSALVQPR
jgi:gamma-glutamyltranspeptidase/glutathione hydrolase